VFLHLIRAHGLDYRNDPVMQALRRTGVGHTMDRSVVIFRQQVARSEIAEALQGQPRWVLVKEDNRGVALLPAADLVRHLQENQEQTSVDLLAIPARRLAPAPIHLQATLQQAAEALTDTGIDALYVTRTTAPGIDRVYGVLTRADIEHSYRL
jgi:CIC family chloride channel protein